MSSDSLITSFNVFLGCLMQLLYPDNSRGDYLLFFQRKYNTHYTARILLQHDNWPAIMERGGSVPSLAPKMGAGRREMSGKIDTDY